MELLPGERVDDIGRGYRIIQSPDAPCFSVDAVLLADFVSCSGRKMLVDLGTGTGILPLLICRRFPDLKATAIEIMPRMADMAARSVKGNDMEQQIDIICGDIKDIHKLVGREKADIVTANPPYYRMGHGKSNCDPLFAAARQECHCTLQDVMDSAFTVLRSCGLFAIIIRADRFPEAIELMQKKGFSVTKVRPVQPYSDKAANLVLIESVKKKSSGFKMLPPLIIYSSLNEYTQEMKDIYAR